MVCALTACGSREAPFAAVPATPTISALFDAVATSTPVPVAPTSTGVPEPAEIERAPVAEVLGEVVIFDDALADDWSLDESWSSELVLDEETVVFAGAESIAVTPERERGAIFFTLSEGAEKPVRREDVVGISFQISGGAEYIGNDELAVSIVGSNALPYFTREKTVVQQREDADLEFSETRLYFLDINTDIPPDTWVEVVVWLDNLIFDPEYEYVTGFYIKNAPSFLNTYYIDEVKLLVVNGGL
jgi:hypothetical protein